MILKIKEQVFFPKETKATIRWHIIPDITACSWVDRTTFPSHEVPDFEDRPEFKQYGAKGNDVLEIAYDTRDRDGHHWAHVYSNSGCDDGALAYLLNDDGKTIEKLG
jgi:hypothetical protein